MREATPLGAACPFCRESGASEVPSRQTERIVMKCDGCGRHSTVRNGKRYPHDTPDDPNSIYATKVRY